MLVRLKRVLAKATTFACYGYPIALLLVTILLRFGSRSSTLLAAALYLPPQGYLFPLALLVPLGLLGLPRAAWVSMCLGVSVALFGLMGLKMHVPGQAVQARVIVTMNVDSAYAGVPELVQKVLAHQPDLVFLQEVGSRGEELASALRTALPHVLVQDQFVMASRFPLSDLRRPETAFVRGRDRRPRYVRVKIELPEGPIAAYNVHPISPRPAFMVARNGGFRSQLASGNLFSEATRDAIWKNIEIREFELRSAAEHAKAETLPVLIAGDLNLPNNSAFFVRTFGAWHDAFAEAGLGFGFTFPAKLPFLRLDRVLVSPGIHALAASIGCRGLSDHLCLVTRLEFSPR